MEFRLQTFSMGILGLKWQTGLKICLKSHQESALFGLINQLIFDTVFS